MNIAKQDAKISKLKWELFEDDNQLLIDDQDYNLGIDYKTKDKNWVSSSLIFMFSFT